MCIRDRLADVNSHYIRQASEQELIGRIKDLFAHRAEGAQPKARFEAVGWDRLAAALPGLKPRAKTLLDLVDGASWLIVERPLPLDDKARKLLEGDARSLLTRLKAELTQVTDWQPAALETVSYTHLTLPTIYSV